MKDKDLRLHSKFNSQPSSNASGGDRTWCGKPDAPQQVLKTGLFSQTVQARIYMKVDIRHTFASRLIMAGVDLRTVQELMGHKTIAMTCRYAHLAPSHKLAAVERLVSRFPQAERVALEEVSFEPSATRTATGTKEHSATDRLLEQVKGSSTIN